LQHRLVKGFLGPAEGGVLCGRSPDKVAVMAGRRVTAAEASGRRAVLWIDSDDGGRQCVETDHIIASTGFRPNIRRLPFLGTEIKSQLKLVGSASELSARFESSVPGLFMVGAAATSSFGPVLRFARGAKFAARHLSNLLARTSHLGKRLASADATR
jgi:hypothetical protein